MIGAYNFCGLQLFFLLFLAAAAGNKEMSTDDDATNMTSQFCLRDVKFCGLDPKDQPQVESDNRAKMRSKVLNLG